MPDRLDHAPKFFMLRSGLHVQGVHLWLPDPDRPGTMRRTNLVLTEGGGVIEVATNPPPMATFQYADTCPTCNGAGLLPGKAT